MTVYVDDWRQPARVGRLQARWSHLTVGPADDIAELHTFAASIGLRRSWFQDLPWPKGHYDVTESKRQAAIAAGAVAVPWREAAVARRQAAEEAQRKTEAAADPLEQALDVINERFGPATVIHASDLNPPPMSRAEAADHIRAWNETVYARAGLPSPYATTTVSTGPEPAAGPGGEAAEPEPEA